MNEDVIIIVIQVEGCIAGHVQLGGQTVGEGDNVFINGNEMTEACVENQAVGFFVLTESSIVGQEEFGVHALFGVLLPVAVVERDAAVHEGMPSAVGLRRRQDAPFHVFVV